MNQSKSNSSAFGWSFFENVAITFINFFIGVILARLLLPEDFGIIGVTAVFLAILPIFSDGGFGSALIQKKDCTEKDFNSVFYFNILISIFLYVLVVSSSEFIQSFFQIEELSSVLNILSINIIIVSFGSVQSVVLTKNLNFKLLSKVSISSQIISGILAISLAYLGYGVWSLVFKTLINSILMVSLLFLFNSWKPKLIFSFTALKNLFSFGFNLLLSTLLNNIFENLYFFIIAKYYSAEKLGFYTRAEMLKNLPSQNLTSVIQRVSFPLLSNIQDDDVRLKENYRKLIRLSVFISSFLLFFLFATSKSLVPVLFGVKWLPIVPMVQLFCFSAFLYPVHALNLNILNVKGRSDLYFRVEIIKKILLIPGILIAISIGIEELLIYLIFYSIGCYFINASFGGKLIDYPVKDQILDILPSVIFNLFISFLVFFISYLSFPAIALLSLQIVFGMLILIVAAEIIKPYSYVKIKELVSSKTLKSNF